MRNTLAISFAYMLSSFSLAADKPALPKSDNYILLPAQQWQFQPGPRAIKVWIRYPGGQLENVNAQTGLALTLHNWGGNDWGGAVDPAVLCGDYSLVSISLDYLQSGTYDPNGKAPYDFGCLQAIDALTALHFVFDQLQQCGVAFDKGRIYAVGGSGGGNVALMANKFAPRTFACVVDISGMAKLPSDIAFGTASVLNAGYSPDPNSPRYLTPDAQCIRFVAEPNHLQLMKSVGSKTKIVVIHGMTDHVCPVDDTLEMIFNFKTAGLETDGHIISDHDLDSAVITNTGHSLGNRTLIFTKFAGKYINPSSPSAVRRMSKTDFESRDEIRFPTPNGFYLVSYRQGYPEISFTARK